MLSITNKNHYYYAEYFMLINICRHLYRCCWFRVSGIWLPDTLWIGTLLLILLGNISGCFSMSLLTKVSPMCNSLQLAAMSILETRLAAGVVNCGILAVGCGLLMTTAVTFARQNNYLPLLFAVPLFYSLRISALCGRRLLLPDSTIL